MEDLRNALETKFMTDKIQLDYEKEQLLMKIGELEAKLRLMSEMANDIEKFRALVV